MKKMSKKKWIEECEQVIKLLSTRQKIDEKKIDTLHRAIKNFIPLDTGVTDVWRKIKKALKTYNQNISEEPQLVIDELGYESWRLHGILHREDGPAITDKDDGSKWWYQKGVLHRENGPAVEMACGIEGWFINGVSYTKKEFNSSLKNKLKI